MTTNLVLLVCITWQLVSAAGAACDHLAVNPQGEVFFHDTAAKRTRKLGVDGSVNDEPAIAVDKAFAFTADGRAVTVANLNATCVTVTNSGSIYATEADAGNVWLIKPDGAKSLLDEGLQRPTGIALSPDGLWLAVMESGTHWGYSYRVKPDGAVELEQQFYWAHVPDWADDSGAGSMCMDRDGHAYVATHLDVQVFDRKRPLPRHPSAAGGRSDERPSAARSSTRCSSRAVASFTSGT